MEGDMGIYRFGSHHGGHLGFMPKPFVLYILNVVLRVAGPQKHIFSHFNHHSNLNRSGDICIYIFGGHLGRHLGFHPLKVTSWWGGSISRMDQYIKLYNCAKFGAFITFCTILLLCRWTSMKYSIIYIWLFLFFDHGHQSVSPGWMLLCRKVHHAVLSSRHMCLSKKHA